MGNVVVRPANPNTQKIQVPAGPTLIDYQAVPRLYEFDFDKAVEDHGYNVLLERSLRCGCMSRNSNMPLSGCVSCNGTGFIYPESITTRVLMQSMNFPRKLDQWGVQNPGTVSITCRYLDRITTLDRVTMVDATSIHTELLQFFQDKRGAGYYSAYCVYIPLQIDDFYLFQSETLPLKPLVLGTDYTLSGRTISLTAQYDEYQYAGGSEFSGTIRYHFNPQYVVTEVQRDIIQNSKFACDGNLHMQNFPIHCIGRLTHYIGKDSVNGF